MKKYTRYIIVISITILVIGFMVVVLPSIYENICKSRIYEEFNTTNPDVYSANVHIVRESKDELGYGFSAGASGVIIGKDCNTYYVLTAKHVMDVEENERIIVGLSDIPTYTEYKRKFDEYVPASEYYAEFYSTIDVISTDEKSDLALISFESDEELTVLDVASEPAKKGDKIMVIGNPHASGHNTTTYGKVTSKGKKDFTISDDGYTYEVQKYNAYVTEGNSGCMVLNKNNEIVGIAIGGSTDFFKRFLYGVMIASDDIMSFIEESGLNL